MALTQPQVADAAHALYLASQSMATRMVKGDLTTAVTAVDAWATTNTTSYLAALPEPFKTQSSAAEKALILAYVCMKRAGVI